MFLREIPISSGYCFFLGFSKYVYLFKDTSIVISLFECAYGLKWLMQLINWTHNNNVILRQNFTLSVIFVVIY